MRVLVVPCGSEIGLEIYRSLADSKNIKLFGANSLKDYSYHLYKNNFHLVPLISDEDFIYEVSQLVQLLGITHIIPGHDDAALKLKKAEEILNSIVVTSSYETNYICRSKSRTYKALESVIPTPKLFDVNEVDNSYLPLFVKPDIGQGSNGAFRLDKISKLDNVDEGSILLEYLPGKEYTVDCLSNSSGSLLYASGRERIAIKSGIAIKTKTSSEDFFVELAEKISSCLELKGAWFFQIKESKNGDYTLLEVGTRIAGSMATNRAKGVNFAELSLYISSGLDVEILVNDYCVELDRALANKYSISLQYEEVFVDFDDCIFINEKVNYSLLAFLFKARDESKRVVLISRHKGNLKRKLDQLRISQVFDEIIHITDGTPKSSFIKNNQSIFIDDSFSERYDVKRKLGIHCFSIDMIEML